MWLIGLFHAAMACETPTNNRQVHEALEMALGAYEDLDDVGFRTHLLQVTEHLGCLNEPVDPSLAASFHRVVGLEAFSRRDLGRAEQSFAAARISDNSYTFPPRLVPEASPIHTHYAALELSKLVPTTLARPASGTLWIDGRPSSNRRPLPSIFQRADEQGGVIQSVVLSSTAPDPFYPREEQKRGFRVSAPLLVAAGVAAGGSVALWAGARSQQGALRKGGHSEAVATRLQTTGNAMTVANVGLGVLAAGLGVVSLTVDNL